MADYNHLSDGRPDGVMVSQAAADKIGMYGAVPVVQRATAASHTTIATTVAVSSSPWGFAGSTQANALTAAVAEIQATLVALGIWAA